MSKRLFLLGCCASVAVLNAGDFRQATWGMTRAQVQATEAVPPAEVRESSGETIVRYGSIPLGELASRVVYIFAHDKLVRAKYVFDEKHGDPNGFIRDFRTIEPVLRGQLGMPVSERAFWADDKYQDEPQAYLTQDRASSADILPSDPYAGLSLSAGHLKLYTRWRGDRSKISHGLTGEDSRITHQVEFLSVQLEKLEAEVRAQAATESKK